MKRSIFFTSIYVVIFIVVSVPLILNIKIISNDFVEEKKIQTPNDPKCLLLAKKGEKISRNEICLATNKKYKNCCGAL